MITLPAKLTRRESAMIRIGLKREAARRRASGDETWRIWHDLATELAPIERMEIRERLISIDTADINSKLRGETHEQQ